MFTSFAIYIWGDSYKKVKGEAERDQKRKRENKQKGAKKEIREENVKQNYLEYFAIRCTRLLDTILHIAERFHQYL